MLVDMADTKKQILLHGVAVLCFGTLMILLLKWSIRGFWEMGEGDLSGLVKGPARLMVTALLGMIWFYAQALVAKVPNRLR